MANTIVFLLQIVGAVIFAGSRIIRLTQTTEGALVMEFVSILAFLLLNLSLAIRANREKPSTPGIQSVTVYTVWTALVSGMLVATVSNQYVWSRADSATLAFNVGAGWAIYVIGRNENLPLADPMVRGWMALVFKSFPQVMLAVTIWGASGASLPLIAILVGHGTILLRLAQIILTGNLNGWVRSSRALLLSEAGNEASWILVSIAWAFR